MSDDPARELVVRSEPREVLAWGLGAWLVAGVFALAAWGAAVSEGPFWGIMMALLALGMAQKGLALLRELTIARPRVRVDEQGLAVRELGSREVVFIPWSQLEALELPPPGQHRTLGVVELRGRPHPRTQGWWQRARALWTRSERTQRRSVLALERELDELVAGVNGWLELFHRGLGAGAEEPPALPAGGRTPEKKASGGDSGGEEAAYGVLDYLAVQHPGSR